MTTTTTTPDPYSWRRFVVTGPEWRTCQQAAHAAPNSALRHAVGVALTNRISGGRVGLSWPEPGRPDTGPVTMTLGTAEAAEWLVDALAAYGEHDIAATIRNSAIIPNEPRTSHVWTATAPDGTLHMGLKPTGPPMA